MSGPKEPTIDEEAPMIWWGILFVYILLFLITGAVTFLLPDHHSVLNQDVQNALSNLKDTDTKQFVLQSLQSKSSAHQSLTTLASHSLNVVLGALLGFLSASAVFLFRKPSSPAKTTVSTSSTPTDTLEPPVSTNDTETPDIPVSNNQTASAPQPTKVQL